MDWNRKSLLPTCLPTATVEVSSSRGKACRSTSLSQPPDSECECHRSQNLAFAALIRLELIGLLSLRGAICSCVPSTCVSCCSDFRIVRGEFLRLKQLGKAVSSNRRAAVDQPEIFCGEGARRWQSSAQREPFLQLCNGLRPSHEQLPK